MPTTSTAAEQQPRQKCQENADLLRRFSLGPDRDTLAPHGTAQKGNAKGKRRTPVIYCNLCREMRPSRNACSAVLATVHFGSEALSESEKESRPLDI